MTSTAEVLVMSILGIAIAVGNIVLWSRVLKTEERFRLYIERRHDVTIERAARGHWRVSSERHSWLARLAIELWQLAYFMGAFVVWAIGLLLCVGGMSLVHRAFN